MLDLTKIIIYNNFSNLLKALLIQILKGLIDVDNSFNFEKPLIFFIDIHKYGLLEVQQKHLLSGSKTCPRIQ